VSTIRCPHCREHIDSVIYPTHEAEHLKQGASDAVTASPPPYSTKPPEEAISLSRIASRGLKNLTIGCDPEPREFVVRVVHTESGREFSPFLVRAKDETTARTLCQRRYLNVQSVEPYVEQEGVAKPRLLPYGPPTSDTDFELDYGNRPAETTSQSGGPPAYMLAAFGWLLCGPFGAMIGWYAGSHSEGRRGD
jgi:hypothetical protein